MDNPETKANIGRKTQNGGKQKQTHNKKVKIMVCWSTTR